MMKVQEESKNFVISEHIFRSRRMLEQAVAEAMGCQLKKVTLKDAETGEVVADVSHGDVLAHCENSAEKFVVRLSRYRDKSGAGKGTGAEPPRQEDERKKIVQAQKKLEELNIEIKRKEEEDTKLKLECDALDKNLVEKRGTKRMLNTMIRACRERLSGQIGGRIDELRAAANHRDGDKGNASSGV